jgi:hypothetical protein
MFYFAQILLRFDRFKGKKTAKFLVFCVILAVCFLLIFALSSVGQGLKINLSVDTQRWAKFEFPQARGLSISTPELGLLKSKYSLTKDFSLDYYRFQLNFKTKIVPYYVSNPLNFQVFDFVAQNDQNKLTENWLSNLNKSLEKEDKDKAKSLFQFEIPVKFPPIVSRIIGEGGPGLKVTGFRKITFSGKSSWEEGLQSTATSKQSKFPSLNMEQVSQFTINGTIGSKISVKVDQDSKRETDLENTLHLQYTGDEDEIVKTIEAGNTNLTVGGGSLIGYSQQVQGLFGIKAQAQIGGMELTFITSQEKGSTEKTEFSAGAEVNTRPIRDFNYLSGTFFYIGQDGALGHKKDDFFPGDSIVEIEVYLSNNTINQASNNCNHGIAYVDPTRPDTAGGEFEYRRFKRLDYDAYYVQKTKKTVTTSAGVQGVTIPYIKLATSLGSNDILAAYYVVRHENGDSTIIGNLSYYENGTTEGDTTFLLKLIRPSIPRPEHVTWEYEWRNVYSLGAKNIDPSGLTIDIYKGSNGTEKIAVDPNHQEGKRYLQILGLDRYDTKGNLGSDGLFDYGQVDFGAGLLFFPDRHPFATSYSYTQNGGDTLTDKVDTIYKSTNDYVKTQASKYYIYVESKTRKAEYSLGHSPIIEGSEVVTLNGKTLSRGTDYDISYEMGEITFLTDDVLDPTAKVTVDYEYAPLLMPEKKSLFGVGMKYDLGENTKWGAAFIYKSEKTSEEKPRVNEEPWRNLVWDTNLSFALSPAIMTRLVDALPFVETEAASSFSLSTEIAGSLPDPNLKNKAFIDDFEGSLDYTDLSIRRGVWTLASLPDTSWQRGKMLWYNPYEQVLVKEIWPQKESNRGEERTNVLNIAYVPSRPHFPRDTLFDALKIEKTTNGIMRPLSQGSYDQTRARFLEIWVRGNKGILSVDLGQISEDLNFNRILDTEDKLRNGQRDGVLDKDEDTGLDGLFDYEEPGYNSVTNPDPNNDDWSYDQEKNRDDYTKINGTEGNKEDPDKPKKPDTEDINYNGSLDLTNSYFTYKINLSDTNYVKDTYSNGWRLYRLALEDTDATVGTPDWNLIQFARIRLTNADTNSCLVQIASIQLVGNKWEREDIARKDTLSEPVTEDETFEIFVTNTQENSDYNPPPGVAGVLDRTTNVRSKEQSLVLKFDNLKPGHVATAKRILYQGEDYTNYNKMKMWIHGDEGNPPQVLFFFRIGPDSTNYYEYHTQLLPGWNEMTIDFNQITALKLKIPTDSSAISEGNYRVKGSPSLSTVKWFIVGVENRDSTLAQRGEVWMDELGVTDIRKEPGFAGNASLSMKFADLLNLGINFSKNDGEFRTLTQKNVSQNPASTSWGVNAGVSWDKFIPPSWGFQFPMSLTWSKTTNIPRLKPGSDIVLPASVKKDYRSETVSKSISFSPRYVKNTNNWLLKLTLKRLNINTISYSRSDATDPNTPVSWGEQYSFGGGYDLSIGKKPFVMPFAWAKFFFVPKELSQTKLFLSYDKLNLNGSVNASKSYSRNAAGNETQKYVRDFNGSVSFGMKPLNCMNVDYTLNTARDIRGNEDLKFSVIPKNAKLGIEINRNQSFSVGYQPTILSFISQTFSFNSSYSEDSDPQKSRGISVNNSSARGVNFTLNLNKIFKEPKPNEPKPQEPKPQESQPQELKSKERKKGLSLNPWFWFRHLMNRITPPTGSYKSNINSSVSGLLRRPSLAYQFGLANQVGVPFDPNSQYVTSDITRTSQSYEVRSGMGLYRGIDVTLSYSRRISDQTSSTVPTKNISKTFPDMTLSWGGLERFKLFRKMISTASFKSGYSRKADITEEVQTHRHLSEDISQNFSPLGYWSFNWKNGLNTTLRIDKSVDEKGELQGTGASKNVTKNYDNTYALSGRYSFKAPQGIKFPFLRKIKFQSNLTILVDLSQKYTKQESSIPGQGFNTNSDVSTFNFSASVGYNFSSQVQGGMNMGWIDTNDRKSDVKRHNRELGIWIEFKF